MATDYCTSPVTPKGQVIFGIGCGLLTVMIRYFGSYPEGVSYAILIMEPVYVAKTEKEKAMQWALLQYTEPRNRKLVLEALHGF